MFVLDRLGFWAGEKQLALDFLLDVDLWGWFAAYRVVQGFKSVALLMKLGHRQEAVLVCGHLRQRERGERKREVIHCMNEIRLMIDPVTIVLDEVQQFR